MERIAERKIMAAPRWQPAPRRAPSMLGRPRLGVTAMEATDTAMVSVASFGATFAGFYLLFGSDSAGLRITGALAAAFGVSGLLNQLGRL